MLDLVNGDYNKIYYNTHKKLPESFSIHIQIFYLISIPKKRYLVFKSKKIKPKLIFLKEMKFHLK
jgi:hypothetical protein